MRRDHGVRLDHDEHVFPVRPEAREKDPEGSIAGSEARPDRCAPQVGELLVKVEILDSQVGTRLEDGSQRGEHVQAQDEHGGMMRDGDSKRQPRQFMASPTEKTGPG